MIVGLNHAERNESQLRSSASAVPGHGRVPAPSPRLNGTNGIAEGIKPSPKQVSLGPFALENLFAAGTITLTLPSNGIPCEHSSPAGEHLEWQALCYAQKDSKGLWYLLCDQERIRAVIHKLDETLSATLAFLIDNYFAISTYTTSFFHSAIILRIYLIPYDLPGVQGRLRRRDEAKFLIPARKLLRSLLSRLSRHPADWRGEELDTQDRHSLSLDQHDRSLAQIFNGLSTTSAEATLPEITGLRSPLYNYQRESVATMLQREEHARVIADPLYLAVAGLQGETFYLQPASLELLRECPKLTQHKGGFLCEELGTGKTVMTLALILASKNTLPTVPDGLAAPKGMNDSSTIFTPVSLKYFPYRGHVEGRSAACAKVGEARRPHTLPSLVEILCDYIRTSPEQVTSQSLEDEFGQHQLLEPLMRNTPFYLHLEADFTRENIQRYRKQVPPRVMYLSSATLIVVPRTLATQWTSEILKHCTASIRYLVIKNKTRIPPPHRLASDYDIVIIKDTRITAESSKDDLSLLDTGYMCGCPMFPHIRIPNCTCEGPRDVSPLLQVRWKRIVRDEGHNAASLSTNLNHFLKLASAERRWIVTGTPTTNLLGLNFGKSSEELPADLDVFEKTLSTTESSQSSSDVLMTSDPPILDNDGTDDLEYPVYYWSASDREDIRKLGSMMEHSLKIPLFAADPRAFESFVAGPLFGKGGPLPGAIQVLTQVMSAYMIRHRIEDVEKDVILPTLTEETVLLDLDPFAQMTYNATLSLIGVNAVDSERTDQDYLFHATKTAALQSTIENLSHSLFWRVEEEELDIDLPGAIRRAEGAIVHATERNQPESDIRLVEDSIRHLRKALDHDVYRKMQHQLEMPFRIHSLPFRTQNAWGTYAEEGNLGTCFMTSLYATELRQIVERQPLVSEDHLVDMADLMRLKEEKRIELIEARKALVKRNLGQGRKGEEKRRKGEAEVGKLKMDQMRKTVESKEKMEEVEREYHAAQKQLKEMARLDDGYGEDASPLLLASSTSKRVYRESSGTSERSVLLRKSRFMKARIGNSTSSKLNYILNEVLKYSATEKFLIFSAQPFNLVHISEGLELIGIKHILWGSAPGVNADRRDHELTTFETSDTYRVLLMELRHGARGLNIVSASRVIFCEPVWQADVESQAIKRVHRIGQTHPVTVKTLAIRNTFEEYMIQRRKDLKGAITKGKGMIEEMGIRHYLQNPVFLENEPQVEVELDVPFLRFPDEEECSSEADRENAFVYADDKIDGELGRRTESGDGIDRLLEGASNTHASDIVNHNSMLPSPPPRKRMRLVHFA